MGEEAQTELLAPRCRIAATALLLVPVARVRKPPTAPLVGASWMCAASCRTVRCGCVRLDQVARGTDGCGEERCLLSSTVRQGDATKSADLCTNHQEWLSAVSVLLCSCLISRAARSATIGRPSMRIVSVGKSK